MRQSTAATFASLALALALAAPAFAHGDFEPTRLQPRTTSNGAPVGSRPLARGARGLDVADLQLALAWHGFPSGPLDGHFGAKTEAALRLFQRWARLTPDGRAGASTFAALRKPVPRSPLALTAPSTAPFGDGFGPRGGGFHAGLDFLARAGTSATAAESGRVVFAARHPGGWGKLVVLAHRAGVRTFYAHLSRIDVRLGQSIASGSTVGLVGATGRATGPHLHFEVRLRGAAVDPVTALG
jgi:murein DD-endopeptidase MepM/ murein hydrolase activator NlpD